MYTSWKKSSLFYAPQALGHIIQKKHQRCHITHTKILFISTLSTKQMEKRINPFAPAATGTANSASDCMNQGGLEKKITHETHAFSQPASQSFNHRVRWILTRCILVL